MHCKLSHMDRQRSVSVCLLLSVEEHIARQSMHLFSAATGPLLARPQTRYAELYQYSLISILINQLVN